MCVDLLARRCMSAQDKSRIGLAFERETLLISKMTFLFLIVAMIILLVKGSIIYVSPHGTNATQCGSSLAVACATLSLAVSAAAANDTLLLSAGERFEVDQTLVIRVSNLSIHSAALSTSTRPTVAARHSASTVFVFDAAVRSFSVANLNFALEQFDVYSAVIFSNASGALEARVENVTLTQFNVLPPPASAPTIVSCRLYHCAMIQIAAAAVLSVAVRSVEFLSADWRYAPFNSQLIHVDVSANQSGTITFDDVSARDLFTVALFVVGCGEGADCRVEFTRVAIESSHVSLFSGQGSIFVESASNSTIAIDFADCVFRNVTSSIAAGIVRLELAGVSSNVTVSNCSFIDNVSSLSRQLGGVFFVAGSQGSSVSLTVVDSTFRHIVPERSIVSSSTCSFLSVLFGDGCVSGAVSVRRSIFENSGCAALEVRPFNPLCGEDDTNYRNESVLIEDCTVRNNSAANQGLVWLRTSCHTADWAMDVRRSSFLNNRASSSTLGTPLHIEVDTDAQRGFLAAIDSCAFVGNLAGNRAGAILLSQMSSAQSVVEPMTLAVSNCSLANNRVRTGDGTEQIVTDFARVRLADTTVLAASGVDEEANLASFGMGQFQRLYNASSSSFQCSPGRSVSVVMRSSDSINYVDDIDIVCTLCPMSTYNLGGDTLVYSAAGLVVAPAEPFCLDCPIGSRVNCSGDTPGAAPGFWSRPQAGDPDLTFFKCPKNFCCQSVEGCASPDACSGHRQGALCGACMPGYTHAFATHSACVLESVCTPTRVWLGNVAVVAAALVLVLHTALRTSAKSDGLIKVFVAFCNIAQVVMINSLALAPTPTTDGALSNAVYSALSVVSGLFPQSVTVAAFCPLVTMTSFQKMLAPLFAPVSLFILWIVVSLGLVVRHVFKSYRRRRGELTRLLNDEPAAAAAATESIPTYRILASLLSLMDFSLFIVVGTCVSLLTTVELVPLGDDEPQCRFWQAGDTECSAGTTAFASLMLCAVLITPVSLVVWRRFRAHSPGGEAVYDVFQSPFARHAQLYNFAIVGRRVAVAFVNAFVGDNELRVLLIRSVLVAACATHVYFGAPFASKWVNRLEAVSLCALLLASMIQWTSASPEHVDMYTTTNNIQGVMLLFCFIALLVAVAWKAIQALIRCRRGAKTGNSEKAADKDKDKDVAPLEI
jgi:hypothetical protein